MYILLSVEAENSAPQEKRGHLGATPPRDRGSQWCNRLLQNRLHTHLVGLEIHTLGGLDTPYGRGGAGAFLVFPFSPASPRAFYYIPRRLIVGETNLNPVG